MAQSKQNEQNKKQENQGDKKVQQADDHYIGNYEKAPKFSRDNKHITDGYRINFNTPRKICQSLFMIHNESVNIWSHCIPAIFIIIFIGTFFFIVDGEALRRSISGYQEGLKNGVDHYMHALHNLSLIAEYDKFSKHTTAEMDQLKQTVLNNYAQFTKRLTQTSEEYQKIVESEVEGMKTSIKDVFEKNKAQFQKAKLEFQKKLAPLLFEEINHRLNSTWFNELKQNIQLLKKEIDSENFQVLQLNKHLPNPHDISRWPIVLFLSTAAFCLLCSTLFHLFFPMSQKIYLITNRFDYAGISILISGSAFPPLYYGMYCQLDVAIFYLIAILMVASFCFTVCLFEWIHRPGHEAYKGWLFAGFGISLLIPCGHMVINEVFFGNYGDPFLFSTAVPYIALLGASYLGGVYIYVQRCPQRQNPGKYNLCGHSHQIWHCFVIMGIFWTYLAAIQLFEMRKVSVCPA